MKITLTIFLTLYVLTSCKTQIKKENQKEPFIEFTALCDLKEGQFDYKTIEEHMSDIYYNRDVKVENNETEISFEFVSSCCLEFEGQWRIQDETLYLSYKNKDESNLGCDCKCNYRLKYKFNTKVYTWNRIRIIDSL